MLKKILNTLSLTQKEEDRKAKLQRDLMRHEAKIGGELFGPVPNGHRREFFCLDRNTWVWHEEWTEENGNYRIMTTRYDIRPTGILKSQNGNHYQHVSLSEAQHLYQAIVMYNKRVRNEIYNFAT